MDRLTGEEIRVLRKKTLFHGKKRLVDFSKIIIIAIVIIIIIMLWDLRYLDSNFSHYLKPRQTL